MPGPMTIGRPESGGQSYVERRPAAALDAYVSSVWIQQVAADAAPYAQRDIPNGGVELLCPVGGAPVVAGPRTEPHVRELAPGTTVVGARFHPGAASAALGLPAAELVDLAVDVQELWGERGRALEELIGAAASPEAALEGLQGQLVDRVAGTDGPDPLVSAAVAQLRWGTDDVLSLASSLYISERQLRRRCQAAVGLAPKPLHRMMRFQRFLALAQHAIATGRPASDEGLAMLAAQAGYADQPHLNRECLRLTGASPGAFLGAAQDHCACGHDHSASFAPLLRARRAVGTLH
jgi:AraC-like DNA-binding protein